MRRDQEFLSKNQFLTFKSKHHQKTFGIYSFSSIHSYKSIVFCHWCTNISYHIISYHSYHSVHFSRSSRPTLRYLLLTDLLLSHHGHHLGLLLNVVRVERHRSSYNTNISPGLPSRWRFISYLRGRAGWLLGLRTVGCTSRDETSGGRRLGRRHPCPRPGHPTWTSR